MNEKRNFDYKRLHPFKWYILENFPFLEDSIDVLTNYQLFCKLGEMYNKQVNAINTLGIQVEGLTDWFDNLDVQDEVNNKLDEMAESGELEEIIGAYLNSKAIFGFNSIDEMKTAENLIDGSYAKTYGKETYNDGLGQFYKIREITNQDIIDNVTIIALTNDNLIAELVPSTEINVKYFGAVGNGEIDDIDSITKAIDYAKSKNIYNIYFPEGTYIISNQIKMFSNLNIFGDGENTIIKANNFTNQNTYKSMIILENMVMDETQNNNIKNISIKNIKLYNNGLTDAGHDGLIQFRGVRNAIIENIFADVKGNNCWGIILFSSNQNVKVDNVKIDNISDDNSLGGCLWIRNGVNSTAEDSETKAIFVNNCSFTSTAKDESFCISDGVSGGHVEVEVNNITIDGKATTNLPNYLLVINTISENGFIRANINNINIKGNANTYAVLCRAYNNLYSNFNVINNNYNINMIKGGGILGNSRAEYIFNNCNIHITENKRACFGIILTNSYTNATCEASKVRNCVIESGSRNCCEDCVDITNSVLRSSNKGIHTYGNVKMIVANNEIYANVNAIHMQNNGTTGGHDSIFIGNYMQRLDDSSNTGSIAISVPNIKSSRSLANRYLIKTGSTSGESYGFNYYDNTTGSSNYLKDDNETNV